MPKMIPCEYIGDYKIDLHKYGGPYFNAKGQQITELSLIKGDTIMMPEEEIRGYTILRDLAALNDPLYVGVGKVVLSEHAGKTDDELLAMGYQFHQGRPDFRAITESSPKKKKEGAE